MIWTGRFKGRIWLNGVLIEGINRKKAEQAPMREKIKGLRAHNTVDVGGALGQRGGPASTVD